MAPTTPTLNQRVEELEEVMSNLEEKVTGLVSQAVEKAVGVMKQSLAELLIQNQAEASKKYNGAMDELATRLEGRISRSREHQEAMMYSLRNDQDEFLSEVRSTMTQLQSSPHMPPEKCEGQVSQGESSVKGVFHTPPKGVEI